MSTTNQTESYSSQSLFDSDPEELTLPQEIADVVDGEITESSECEIEEAADELLKVFGPNKNGKKKGRKSTWPDEIVNDLVNVVCSNEYLTKKLIYENTKNSRNGMLYQKIIKEISKLCEERQVEYPYSVTQTRTKFKNCISSCVKQQQ